MSSHLLTIYGLLALSLSMVAPVGASNASTEYQHTVSNIVSNSQSDNGRAATEKDGDNKTSSLDNVNDIADAIQKSNLLGEAFSCKGVTLRMCKNPIFKKTSVWRKSCFYDSNTHPPTYKLCEDVCTSNGFQDQLKCDDFCPGIYIYLCYVLKGLEHSC